jgi:3D (Asp-Asp-Asp) domain-containing protein
MRIAFVFLAMCLLASAARVPRTFTASAYSANGTTADGGETRRHKVAADTDLLPLGSRIRISGAGKYSGEYVVGDTGRKVRGAHLDIFMPSTAEARRFGKKKVRVRVLK